MREYLSSKDFNINFTLLLLPVQKSTLNFFKKTPRGACPHRPKMHPPQLSTFNPIDISLKTSEVVD